MARKTKAPPRPKLSSRITTIRQVAELAGVSTATVSRVFSGAGSVSGDMAEKVKNAAQQLNYHPNRIARNLRTQKTSSIALSISDIENPFFTSVVRGIERVLHDAGYSLVLTNSDENPRLEWEHLLNLRAEGVAGVIIAPTNEKCEPYQEFMQSGVPLVLIDRSPRGLKADRVTVNNQDAVRVAVQHLVKQGHEKIGFIAGLPNVSTSYDRQVGFELGMREHGLTWRPEWVQFGRFRREAGREAMNRILESPERLTAVITANNMMTLGALQGIYEHQMSIPDDIAVVSFDDMDWAPSLNPPLTAIAQPTQEMGTTAAVLMLNRVRQPELPNRHVILDTHLVVRASSGPHRAR